MCGIAGAIDSDAGRAIAQVGMLNGSQGHRGPDHSVVKGVGVFTIGNTRLAVQDLSPSGNQPFTSIDGRYQCVFNGEIYNHRHLAELYRLPMRTNCDGEVIPHLWAKLGAASLAELRGMFALALVDTLEERLYLARDSFGIKPLYWRILAKDRLIFASEVRPLVQLAGRGCIDSQAIVRYLRLGAMAPDQAPFREITALPPNSCAVFDRDSRVAVHRIWPDGPVPLAGAPADLGSALTDSIELHLGADVPTALLLSSGVDSGAIAAVGRRLGRDLHCLNVATREATDESVEAAETARHYGHDFQRVSAALEPSDVARFFGALQRPSVDGLNTYIVSKAAHEAGFKVALSGLGGDEAVGGYSHFRLLRYLPALRATHRMPDALTGAAAGILAQTCGASAAKVTRLLGKGGPRNGSDLCLLQREVLKAPLVAELTGISDQSAFNDSAMRAMRTSGPFGAMVAAELALYLQAMLLPDADSFSMASSVELRVPFVDSQVFWASLKIGADKGRPPGKIAIGTALGDPYLRELASRPKRGFSVPMQLWMDGPLLPVLHAADDAGAAVWSILDRTLALRAGLLPLRARDRWVETWVIAALNAWLETIDAGPQLAV
jgi:asparagine synthase (glutamine-hydrolysing)